MTALAVTILVGACSRPATNTNAAYPAEIAGWSDKVIQDQRAAATKLAADITRAAAAGEKRFVVPPGQYRFGPGGTESLAIRGAKDFEIDATGSTFWLYPFQRKDGILIDNCRNVTLKGVTVDYYPTPYSQGVVTEINGTEGYIAMRVDEGFSSPLDTPSKSANAKIVHFTPEGELLPSRLDWAKEVTATEDGQYRIYPRGGWAWKYDTGIKPGTRVALADRTMRMAVNVANSEACRIQDVTIYASPHMAIIDHLGAGGNVYQNCRVIRRPETRRLLACNADVFHAAGSVRGPTVERCEFSFAADDLINIHGLLSLVQEQPQPDQIDLITQIVPTIAAGAEIRFYAQDSFALKATARVVKAESITLPERIEAADGFVTRKKIAFLKPARVVRVTLDRAVEVAPSDYASADDRIARGTVIRDNFFHDCYTRGVLLKSRDGRIENNRFDNIGIASIGVALDAHFMEAPLPSDIVISGNRITRNGYNDLVSRTDWNYHIGAISVTNEQTKGLPPGPTLSNIVIRDNVIENTATIGILMTNVSGGAITGNTIRGFLDGTPDKMTSGLGGRMQLLNPAYAIVLARSTDIRLEGNTIEQPGPFAKGGIAFYGNVTAAPQTPDAWKDRQP